METDQAHSAIPEAVVEQAMVALNRRWKLVNALPAARPNDVRTVCATIPPLTGPGPNGEWGRWHGPVFFENHPDWPALYRFVPEATDE